MSFEKDCSREKRCETSNEKQVSISGPRRTRLLRTKLERAIFCIDTNALAFMKFAFEDVETERVQNFFLNCALERSRAVHRIVAFAGEQFLRRIGKIERDLLLLESFRQAAELNLDDFL